MTRSFLALLGLLFLLRAVFSIAVCLIFDRHYYESPDESAAHLPDRLILIRELGRAGYGLLLLLPPRLFVRQPLLLVPLLVCSCSYLWVHFEAGLWRGLSIPSAVAPVFVLGLPAVLAVMLIYWERVDGDL